MTNSNQHDLSKGMVIQLFEWHSDVWAEIIATHQQADVLKVLFVRYSAMGQRRWLEEVQSDQIRQSKDRAFLTPRERRTGALHLAEGRQGLDSLSWGLPITPEQHPTREKPQHFQQLAHAGMT